MLKNLTNRMLKTYVEKRENVIGKRQDLKESIKRVLHNNRGAGAVEYGLIIAVVVAMVVAAALVMKPELEKFFKAAANQIAAFMKSNKQ
jgi:Flp pilus assembly pilin Flp